LRLYQSTEDKAILSLIQIVFSHLFFRGGFFNAKKPYKELKLLFFDIEKENLNLLEEKQPLWFLFIFLVRQ
jgi:hypothetical protein